MAPNGDFCQVRPIGLPKDNAPPPPPRDLPSRAPPRRCLFGKANPEEVNRLMEANNKKQIERLKQFTGLEVLGTDKEADGSKRAKTEKPNRVAETIAVEKSTEKRKISPGRTPTTEQNKKKITMTDYYPLTKSAQHASKAEITKSITNVAGMCNITKTPTSTSTTRATADHNDDTHFARVSTSSESS